MKTRKLSYYISLITLLWLVVSCRDPFFPEDTTLSLNYLVIEGHVDTGGEESIIKLSRTGTIYNDISGNFGQVIMESEARVILTSDQGSTWSFTEKTPGTYSLEAELPGNMSYSLNVILRNNQSYFSEFIQPVDSPPIGSVTYDRQEDGVTIYVSTQGTEEAQYFLWQYEEDWVYRAPINTFYKYNPESNQVDFRPMEQQINLCWDQNRIPNIVLENAGRFVDKRIERQKLLFIPLGSEKFYQRYSILVKQMALEPRAFTFWETVRKNSEDIGGIFSPLPSFVESNFSPFEEYENITSIGYLSIGNVSKERLFIDIQDIRPWRARIDDYLGCRPDSIFVTPDNYESRFGIEGLIPVNPAFSNADIVGYYGEFPKCADCTVRGGTTIKPEFWID